MIICFSENFLKLKVYYGELNFEVIEEEPAYTVGKNKISIVTVLILIKNQGGKPFTTS